jgi:hypothetical protein
LWKRPGFAITRIPRIIESQVVQATRVTRHCRRSRKILKRLRVKGQVKPDDDMADNDVAPPIEATSRLHVKVLAVQRVIAVVRSPSRVPLIWFYRIDAAALCPKSASETRQ